MQNTESGRKLNQAMASTGKAVVTTSKAVGKIYFYKSLIILLTLKAFWIELKLNYIFVVGGALSQAKGALSSWWNNFMVNPEQGQKVSEAQDTETHTNNLTDSLTNIPSSINSDKENNEIEPVSNGDLVTMEQNNSLNGGDKHNPGEVHTV